MKKIIQKELLKLKELNDKEAKLSGELGDIIVDKIYLPKEAKEGDVLRVDITAHDQAEEREQKTAKEILNEILNIEG